MKRITAAITAAFILVLAVPALAAPVGAPAGSPAQVKTRLAPTSVATKQANLMGGRHANKITGVHDWTVLPCRHVSLSLVSCTVRFHISDGGYRATVRFTATTYSDTSGGWSSYLWDERDSAGW